MKIPALLLVLLLCAALASAAPTSLANYPEPFLHQGTFSGQIVVGDNAPSGDVLAATDIATALQAQATSQLPPAALASEAGQGNLILIGNGCTNQLILKFINTTDCHLGLPQGRGMLKSLDQGGRHVLIVAGYSTTETRIAARVLAQHANYALTGNEMGVSGTLSAPKIGPLELANPDMQQQNIVVPSCNSNADCNDTAKCTITQGCVELDCPPGTVAGQHRCTQTAQPPAHNGTAPAQAPATPPEPQPAPAATQAPQRQNILQKLFSFLAGLFGQ